MGNIYNTKISFLHSECSEHLAQFLTLSSGVLSCLLQCKITVVFYLILDCAVKEAFQNKQFGLFHSSDWMHTVFWLLI